MTVDLDVVCVKDGIPVDMHFFHDLFLGNIDENIRPIYDYLSDNVEPVFQGKPTTYYDGIRGFEYKVWEITKGLAVKIVKYLIAQKNWGSDVYVMDDWQIKSDIEDLEFFNDGRKVFVVM